MIKAIFLNGESKIRSIWWIPIFFGLLVSFLFPTILIAQKQSAEVPMPMQAILILIVTFICQWLRKEKLTVVTGSLDFTWFRQLVTGLLIGGALMILPALTLRLFGLVQWQVNDPSLLLIYSGLKSFIWVAFAEELLFRGFIFRRLIESFGHWPAQVIIGGMFLLTHFHNPGMEGGTRFLASINIFTASILFGIAYTKTGSLAMSTGIHFMANWTQGALLGFGVSGNKEAGILNPYFAKVPDWITGGNFGLEASLPGLIILLLMTVSLYLWLRPEAP